MAKISIVEDQTNGLVKLSLVERIGEKRKYKVTNNFTGIIKKADPSVIIKLCDLLNPYLPKVSPDEVVIGIPESGVSMACFLGLSRRSKYTYATSRQYDKKGIVSLNESRRGVTHKFYDLNKDDEIILVEDEITTGEGVIEVYNAFKRKQLNLKSICCVIETLNYKARERIKAKTNIDLVSLVRIVLE